MDEEKKEEKPEKRFWGDKQKADRHALKINTKNNNYNVKVFRFGGLYFVGTKEEYNNL